MAKKKTTGTARNYSDPMMGAAHETLEILMASPSAREALSTVQRAIDAEDAYWSPIFSDLDNHDGIGLDELHEMSKSIREAIVKSPIIGRGAHLRYSYVWSKGINLPEIPNRKGAGSSTKLERVLTNSTNRRYFFDGTAHEELEHGLFAAGNVFALVKSGANEARRIPEAEIVGMLLNPDYAEEVWAYRREWRQTQPDGTPKTVSAWYYTDDCPVPQAKRSKKIKGVPVDPSQVIVSISVNRQIGWPLGIPDAVAAVIWAKLYSDFLKHGYVMSRALASIAFRAGVASQAGGDNASMKLANTDGAGATVVQGAANSLTALPTAGRGYDFNSGRPIAAQVATAVQVSIVHLLSDPGAAGSSYGSASNLDLPTKRAIVARQQAWAQFFNRLLAALGVKDAGVTFPSLEEPDFFREVQSLVAGWSTGLLHPDEVRKRMVQLLSVEVLNESVPDGVMLPNNLNSLNRSDVDADGNPTNGEPGGDQGVGQGHNTGAGKGPNANDIRQDDITNRQENGGVDFAEMGRMIEYMTEMIGRNNSAD